jgi:hypothetical protein
MNPVPVTRLEENWRRELAGAALAVHLHRWRLLEPALRPFASPAALTRYLRRSSPGEREDAVLRALLARAREDPLAAQLVLVRLLPGLKARAGRILIDADEREELWSLLLAIAWERIRDYPTERLPRHIAANLILSAARDALRARGKEREQSRCLAEELPAPPLVDPTQGASNVYRALAEAVEASAVSREDARLIALTRLGGESLVALARAAAVPYDVLRVRRARAERRLLLYFGGDVRFGVWKRPLSSARVAGAGSSGPRRCK